MVAVCTFDTESKILGIDMEHMVVSLSPLNVASTIIILTSC